MQPALVRTVLLTAALLPTWLTAARHGPPAPASQPSPSSEIPKDLARSQGPPEVGEILAISGKDHPELIPDYRVWQQVLTRIAVAARTEEGKFEWPHIREALHLSHADEALLVKAADLEKTQAEKDSERINKRIEETKAQYPGKPVSAFDLTIASRQRTLDLVDGLMEKLSPEGQASLLQYKNETLARLTIYVPAGAWDKYRLPR